MKIESHRLDRTSNPSPARPAAPSPVPHRLAAACAALLLAACGGGGGTSAPAAATPAAATPAPAAPATPTTPTTPTTPSTPPTSAAQPPYTISPATLTQTFATGRPAPIYAKATPTTTLAGTYYVSITGGDGVVVSVEATQNADGTLQLVANTSATAAPRHYTGALTVNICKDANCAAQVDGAPFNVPYVIDVTS